MKLLQHIRIETGDLEKKMDVCERGSLVNFATLNFKHHPLKKSTQLFFNELSNLPTLQCPSLYFESFPSTPTYTLCQSLSFLSSLEGFLAPFS